jgi:5-deoxy-glucuronate isomerase
MPRLLRYHQNSNKPIVAAQTEPLSLTYFNLLSLDRGVEFEQRLEAFESVYVVLSGNCNIEVDREQFKNVGQRKDIWSGKADSVYAPAGATVKVQANEVTEIAVAGGFCNVQYTPFRITPDEVEMVDVGSSDTKSHRRIFHILGQNARGRAGNLLVSELLAEEGCWSGYPPHKHDEERGAEETHHEELYHYRFRPETGFGAQLIYQPDGSAESFMVRHGDTCLVDRGYHPTVTSPGHEEYIFTVLVGKHQRSLIQSFDKEHGHLLDKIPGLQGMRDKFK